ncbi:hypothetical protein Xbed_03487 [Xenorhabdus beddingii]|uniref:Uncharacterized protein n=1 Tax=Xenorhabdus beddingii TaxID=40578 RepID=A0A1Y2SC80_9GAMM|nr:hypothetical protein Xbed_03487 [Xenorhabdus beddingii]
MNFTDDTHRNRLMVSVKQVDSGIGDRAANRDLRLGLGERVVRLRQQIGGCG